MNPPVSRRLFLQAIAASGSLLAAAANRIDRAALVRRHNPVARRFDPLSPLSLGNGEFAFTADLTGLQTFPEIYEQKMPLCTMSQWGWHSVPIPSGLDPHGLRLTRFDTFGRSVGYAVDQEGQRELFRWLRENPHRLHLGRIGLRLRLLNGREAQASDITDAEQRLDLWEGILHSRFRLEGVSVAVRTAVHPSRDLLAIEIESLLLADDRLAVRLSFPYGSPEMWAADWSRPEQHRTTMIPLSMSNRLFISRKLDADQYYVSIDAKGGADADWSKSHEVLITSSLAATRLALTVEFQAKHSNEPQPDAAATFAASVAHWRQFWTEGAAIELAGSRDERAPELERRIVLSQYLTAIQCAGTRPPQETGLTVNSWYGKFHLEMHWWHSAQFALWNRTPLLERSLDWYTEILPSARELARSQGYAGARWPKMVGPEGRDSPSAIGPLLVWQQPHPIAYAELCYLANPTRRTLERFRQIVFESAEFMASFAHLDARSNRYVLGPPLIPAQENHQPRETWNPTFELVYWAWGLKTAQEWRRLLGLRREPKWDRVRAGLAPLPVREGVYLAHENCPQTFTERNYDHPSMLGALGVLPGDGVDRETMRRTLARSMRDWQWDRTWGWDYPMTAMTAARLGETRTAIDALLMETEKNRYLPNGHNWQRENLPCYLPGNGGLLYAVAMMAGGWRGAPRMHAPGFPADGSWTVKAEGFRRAILSRI